MKRYMTLIQKVLEHVEEHGNGNFLPVLQVDGYNSDQIKYHFDLAIEARYLRIKDVRGGEPSVPYMGGT